MLSSSGAIPTATSQLHMRKFPDGATIVVEPWRASGFPLVRDLVVDRSAFDKIIEAGGFISVAPGSAPDANLIPIPKIVADMGHSLSEAAEVLVRANVGGVEDALVVGLLTARIPLRLLTVAVMALSVGFVALFGRGADDIGALTLIATATGFAATAGVVGLYGLLASSFPTEVRATATGFTIGIGRGGAVLAPMAAGGLFAADFGIPVVALIMALGSALGALALLGLGYDAKRVAAEAA